MAEVRVVLKSSLRSAKLVVHSLLENFKHSQIFQDKSCAQECLGEINTLLGVRKNRWMGVCLIASILEQSPTDVFTENCLSWLKSLAQILQQEIENIHLCRYTVEVLEKILSISFQFSEISRETSLTIINSLLTNMLNVNLAIYPEIQLGVVTACVKYYPGASSSFAKRIECFLLDVFASDNFMLIQKACNCLALLPRCGCGNASHGDKQVTAWENQFTKILNTLRTVVGELYNNYETSPFSEINSEILQLKKIPAVEPQRTETCVLRVKYLLKCLELMISNGFSHTKSVNIPLDTCIKLIQRILSVSGKTVKSSVALESVLLKFNIATVHFSALNFLSTLILRCGMNLLPYHNILTRLLLSELSWSESNEKVHGFEQEYSELRSSVYDCVQYLVHMTSTVGENTENVKKIIRHATKDIAPRVNTTKLIVPPSTSKNPTHGKKAKRKRIQDDVSQLNQTEQKTDHWANEVICYSGLQAINTMILKGSSDIPAAVLKEVQVLVVELLLETQRISQSQCNYPIPYASPECRKMLYNLLRTLLYNHEPRSPPPLQHAISIFSQGTRDQDLEVSKFCFEAQMFCLTLIHPRVAFISSGLNNLEEQKLCKDMASNSSTGIGHVNTVVDGLSLNRETINVREMFMVNGKQSDGDQRTNSTDVPITTFEKVTDDESALRNDVSNDPSNNEENFTEKKRKNEQFCDDGFELMKNSDLGASKNCATETKVNSNVGSIDVCGNTVVEIPRTEVGFGTDGFDPPVKKRRTQIENKKDEDSSHVKNNDLSNYSTGSNQEFLGSKEDEMLATEMINSFVDSMPD